MGSDRRTDSAGVPWAGRHFDESGFEGDDGSAPPALVGALRGLHAGVGGEAGVIDALRGTRLLVPLVARLGEAGVNDQGHTIDKSAELSIVTVSGPDGRTVLPVFSCVEALSRWNPTARPVPTPVERVALAAASEQTDLVMLDPTSPGEFVIRRPALWAIAQSLPWQPCYSDDAVREAFEHAAHREALVLSVQLAAGDPTARLLGPELVVRLQLASGLSATELDAVLARMQNDWATSDVIADRVDSMKVQLVASL